MKMDVVFLFDVDGVIANVPHEKAWKTATLEWNILPVDFDFKSFYQECVAGIPGLKGAEKILEKFSYYKEKMINNPLEKEEIAREFRETKQKILEDYIHQGEFEIFKDILLIIKKAKEAKIPIAAVSSSENAEGVLRKVGLLDIFDSISLGAIKHRVLKKEDLYSFAFGSLCGKLRINCLPHPIVFEDADKGVMAAKNLGYFCVGIARKGLTSENSLLKIGADIAYNESNLLKKGYTGIIEDIKNLIEGLDKKDYKKSEIDGHKLMYHPERVAEWNKKGDCIPIYVEIGLTNVCNHKCIFCNLDWARGNNLLKTDALLENLKDMKEKGVKSICFAGAGEPLLHPNFSLIVKKTKEIGMDVSFSTNAVLFDEKKAEETLPYTSWIRFSVDAATPKTHAKIHGTSEKDFPIILKNLKKAVEIKKKNNYSTILGVQFLLLEENAGGLLKLAETLKEIGVDNLQVKPYSLNPKSINKISVNYSKFLELQNKLELISDSKFKIYFRFNRIESITGGQDYNTCYGLPFFAIINEKGNIQPCHLYYDEPEFAYGNIYEKKFSEIWKSQRRQEIIKKITDKGVHDCGKGCRLNLINKYLSRLKNPNLHDNFI